MRKWRLWSKLLGQVLGRWFRGRRRRRCCSGLWIREFRLCWDHRLAGRRRLGRGMFGGDVWFRGGRGELVSSRLLGSYFLWVSWGQVGAAEIWTTRLQGLPSLDFVSCRFGVSGKNLQEFVRQRARLLAYGWPWSGRRTDRLMTSVRRYPIFEWAVEILLIWFRSMLSILSYSFWSIFPSFRSSSLAFLTSGMYLASLGNRAA